MADADHDEDDAALARSYGAAALRVLKEIAEQSPDPTARASAWEKLQHHLMRLRQFLATPGISSEARAQAEAMLREFLDS